MSSPLKVDRGALLQGVMWSLIFVAFLFVVLRFWARLYKRTLGIDDGLMLFSWVLFLAEGIIYHYVAISHGTRHWYYLSPEEMEYQLKLNTIHMPIAFTVTGLGRVAVGVTLLRIFGQTCRWERRAIWAMLIVLITATVIDIFAVLFRCGPPQAQWDFAMLAKAKCWSVSSYTKFNRFVVVVQTFTDYLFSILPMFVVWKLKMTLRRRLTVIFMLGLTLITAASATVKLTLQIVLPADDVTWIEVPIGICNSTEAMLIIVFGSVPVLHPLREACACTRRSSAQSKFGTGPPKRPSSSAFECLPPQQSRLGTAEQQANWVKAGDLELARLTDHPAKYMSSEVTADIGTPNQSEEWQSSEDHWKIHVHQQVHQTIAPASSGHDFGNTTGTD